jgi:hypothetical protein
MAKFLLENGAKANYRPGPAGALPALLFIAKSPEMVRTLVSVGRDKANVNEVETNVAGLRGYTPLAYELRRPRGELGNRSIEKIRMLLELGADPDAPAPDDPNLLETINTVRDIAEYNYQETKSDTDREIAQLFSKTEEERAAQQQPVGLGEEAAAAQQQPVGLGEPATARPPPPPPPARRKSWSPPPPPRPGQEVVGVVASPPVEDPAVTSIRATINNARTAYQSRQATKDATMAAINAAEAELRALQGPKVQTRANLLNEIADLRKTIRGGRRRKTPRKRTLKKRRGGKQNVRGPRHR